MKEFDKIRFEIYLEVLNKIEKSVGEEYSICLKELDQLRNGLIPIKYLWRFGNGR